LDARFEEWLRKYPERAASYCDNENNNNNKDVFVTDDDDVKKDFDDFGEEEREEEEEEEESAAFDFKTCPQSFVRERIYLENLRRVERHNEALERGWPTETKLELSADNPFADLTTREYETLMSETGMRKPESPGAETSSREKNEDDENVFATKELKKMTVGSYAFASLGGGSSSSKTLPDDDEKDDENNDNDTSTKGVFGKVVVEQDENDHETSLENNNNNNGKNSTPAMKKSKATDMDAILSKQFPEKEREAVNARVIIPKKMQNVTGSRAKKFPLTDIEDATLDQEFVKYVFKYDKRSEYCPPNDNGDFQWPCEIAFQKQDVFLANLKEIDEQNRLAKKRGSHMRKSITRFADLTQDEFEDAHATYVPKDHQEDKAEREQHRRKTLSKAKKNTSGGRKFGKYIGTRRDDGLFANKEGAVTVEVEVEEQEKKKVGEERDVSSKKKDKTMLTATDESVAKEGFPVNEEESSENQKKEAGDETTIGEVKGGEIETPPKEGRTSSKSSKEETTSSSLSSKKKKNKVAIEEEKERGDEEQEVRAKRAAEEEKTTTRTTKKHLSKEERKEQEERAKKMTPDEIKKARKANKLKNAKQGIARELPQLGEITKDENLKNKVVDAHNFQNDNSSKEDEDVETSNNVIDVQIHEFNDPNANTTTFKKHLDWRNKIDIGPVYSQGACSGCWAYSTVQVIADSKAINTGTRPDLSPYHLLSCDTLDSGCHTGNMATAYAWIGVQRDGILRSRDFSTDITPAEECPLPSNLGSNGEILPDSQVPKPKGIRIDGYCEIAPLEGKDTILALMRAVKQQPIAVGLNIKPLQLYGGGLVQVADCPPASTDSVTAINHAAVIVGWGTDEATKKPYWLIKNSYGVDWGEDGYVRIAMELTEGGAYGACGLYSEQNYPLTDGNNCSEGSDKRWSEIQGSEGDVYLMPDYVLVLPNGGGLLTPAKFTIFGHDVTNLLKYTSVFCFVSCVALILMEIAQCIHPDIETWGSNAISPAAEETKETLLPKRDNDSKDVATTNRHRYGTSENA
jgi:C1A family cysteine protease